MVLGHVRFKVACFQLLQSSRVASNHAIYSLFIFLCGGSAEKRGKIVSERAFSAFGDFKLLQSGRVASNHAIHMVFCGMGPIFEICLHPRSPPATTPPHARSGPGDAVAVVFSRSPRIGKRYGMIALRARPKGHLDPMCVGSFFMPGERCVQLPANCQDDVFGAASSVGARRMGLLSVYVCVSEAGEGAPPCVWHVLNIIDKGL